MLLLRLAVKERRPSWLENAAALPIAFAQVREDALLDQAVINDLGGKTRLIMVASGGCTAALLASMSQVRSLRVVDTNPAQLALTKLKLRLLMETSVEKRLQLLGHLGMPTEARRQKLKALFSEIGLAENVLGRFLWLLDWGPDHVGRYERVFAALRLALASSQTELDSLLSLSNVGEQIRAAAPESLLGKTLGRSVGKGDVAAEFGSIVWGRSDEQSACPVFPPLCPPNSPRACGRDGLRQSLSLANAKRALSRRLFCAVVCLRDAANFP